jgi:dTDP-4-dehydrorhamnose 3,5-epimerase
VKFRQLSIDGAFEVTPLVHGDARGGFMEWYRRDLFVEAVGYPLDLRQSNVSISRAGAVRGIHFADVPPGQAKYVMCVRGAVVDVVVDVREGSPTFGRWEMLRLDDVDRRSVFITEGLGHGFCAITNDATLVYMCSTSYNPAAERSVDPMDPELAIDWPAEQPTLSQRDASAPTLAQARLSGLLPRYETCRQYTQSKRAPHE